VNVSLYEPAAPVIGADAQAIVALAGSNRPPAALGCSTAPRCDGIVPPDSVKPLPLDAPVVTPTSANVTVSHSSPVAATSLFTATDADTDSIVQYDFWDNGSAGGTWLLNGNPLLLGMDNFVRASQLSQVHRAGDDAGPQRGERLQQQDLRGHKPVHRE
jgi:hypothetical protein